MNTAYFAGGCFWCIEPVFQEHPGVSAVTNGYSGGREQAPSYEDVKAQRTGHRETIRIDYDEAQVSYAQLLDTFLQNVDPFDGGGQFIDRGRSYTLAVYWRTRGEETLAREKLAALERSSGRAPQVAVEPFTAFWEAEELHQDWYKKHPAEFRKELEESGRKACPLRLRDP